MTRYMIIANPNAGHGKGAHAIPEIERELTRLGLDFDLVRTERVGHGMSLARQAALAGYQVIVAAGGDGTVNEVLNGLMEAREASEKPPGAGRNMHRSRQRLRTLYQYPGGPAVCLSSAEE